MGRTILHLIFQNDLFECLSDKTIFQITNDDLFINDLNGDSVIDYAFIYDSRQCLNSIVENQVDGFKLYKEIIKLNPGFIDKCLL